MKASRFAFLAALALTAACTVHGVDVPPLSGPSELGLSWSVTATPDMLPQDGFSQSAVVVQVRDASGKGVSGQTLRVETSVGGAAQDFGLLSARSIVTNADGRATVVYTAPPPPPSIGGSGTLVSVDVTPYGGNYMNSTTRSAEIRLLPPGVVLPPASSPTARFTVSPTPVATGVTANFDASTSCATQSACSSTAGITAFSWNFGDGTTSTGSVTSKVFTSPGTYTVTLTVTNDRGLSASTSQAVTVNAAATPTAGFVVTPSGARVGLVLNFNADITRAAPGRTITQYSWNFGDGSPTVTTGFITTHTYTTAGTYTVVLSVMDDAGQRATATTTLTVAP